MLPIVLFVHGGKYSPSYLRKNAYLGVFILKSYIFIVAIDPVVCEVVIDGVGIDMASGTLVGPSREEVRSEFRISDEIGRD